MNHFSLGALGLLALFTIGCGGGGASNPTPGAAGNVGTAGAAGSGTGGSGTAGTNGTGGTGNVVVTPEGMLFMDDFESGAAKWTVTQGTCSVMADTDADGGMSNGSNVLNCLNGGNEARALAGMVGWGEYTVQAKVKVNQMDPGRRIYLAARFTDSSNWYGAAVYDGTPFETEIRKKVGGTSMDISGVPYPFELGRWYTLKFEVKGSTLRVSVDGVQQLESTDTQFASGQIALLVDRSNVSWDDVIVTNP